MVGWPEILNSAPTLRRSRTATFLYGPIHRRRGLIQLQSPNGFSCTKMDPLPWKRPSLVWTRMPLMFTLAS